MGSKTIDKKFCLICWNENPLVDYHKDKGKPDGYRNVCKECRKLKRKRDPKYRFCYKCKKVLPSTSEYFWAKRKGNNERLRSRCKECAKLDAKKSWLKKHYQITLEELNRKKQQCKNQCEICGATQARLVVDHSHQNGEFRGILCDGCNTGIGCFKENIKSLLNAIQYIKERN